VRDNLEASMRDVAEGLLGRPAVPGVAREASTCGASATEITGTSIMKSHNNWQLNDLHGGTTANAPSTPRASNGEIMTLSSQASYSHGHNGWRMTELRAVLLIALGAGCAFVPGRSLAQTRPAAGLLMSRTELNAAAARAATGNNAAAALSIQQRLRDGDFHDGDRVVLSYTTDVVHTDSLTVHAGRMLELPGKIMVPLGGVLRSEIQERVSTEFMKYVRAEQLEVTPLMRVGVLGDVAHPGYFAFGSDIPITDAIMGAGGPTATADLDRSMVRRGNMVYRSVEETRAAIASGMTLDQFGLNAGDELVIGERPGPRSSAILGVVGGLASVVTLFVAMKH
jgi:protein involved in polysaccharide export with SLBB domain